MRNKMKLTLTLLGKSFDAFKPAPFKSSLTTSLLAVAVMSTLSACSASKWHETQGAPNTGDIFAERQVAPPAPPMRPGDHGFISTDHLPAREKHEEPIEDVPALERNDEIKVVNENPKGAEGSVEAIVLNTDVPELKGKKVVLPKKYVSTTPVNDNDADKYFVIQNIATEKLRIYRNCESKSATGECVHKMILETDMAAGRDTASGRSNLGSFRITQWFKFYEDGDHLYPSFIAKNSPALPEAGESLEAWLSKSLLPGGKGRTRGAFGWYTAHLGPDANEQWTHGTLGWGADGLKFIDASKDPSNSGVFERSQGCTRVENQVIALMREILPVGTKMFKVYAREGYGDAKRTRYLNAVAPKWSWTLTKDGTMSTSAKSGAKSVGEVARAAVADRGSYVLDQMPDALALVPGSDGKNEENGNLYNLDPSSMKGVLLVDEGRLAGYSHPRGLRVGGQSDHRLPSLVISKRTGARAVTAPARSTEVTGSFR